ncbi:MAG: adenosylcobalamin-dependent ribonucleoside-diphosphate reductase [Candidatus Aenigmarchaeota archaeon]|nr:adenosylcobalamin-dependent ribonucleoside-diphosphate reductase [Candidatus Aenigmarchaeota archaeon]MBU5689080.1 adenosylcobalamin-dependent ribonucleoside-diphosphate reductase [Candidatus Aenigmarchaeota archaeon]
MAKEISKVKKRDGRIVDFDQNKISEAIWKAVKAVGGKDKSPIPHLTAKVIEMLKQQLKDGEIPDVEMIQDCVEKVLIEEGHARVAKAYILYRQKRAEIRKEKATILEKETIDEVDKQFDVNALRVLKSRYLRKDESGKLVEWPKQLFTRVAVNVGLPNIIYDEKVFDINGKQKKHDFEEFKMNEYNNELKIGKYILNKYHVESLKSLYDYMNDHGKMKVSWSKLYEMIKKGEFDIYEKTIDEFFDLMVSKRFMPNTPAIANFGASLGLGSACFVLDIDDSLDSIMTTLLKASKIFQAGGGLGYNFSKLRPEGDYVSTTGGKSSGPISFMTLFDKMTDVIKQGGMRRGANMGILNINHPDIEKFVKAKEGNKMLRNFNISVLVMPDFWEYYEKNKPYPLVNPRNKKIVKYINPRLLFDMIAYQAWESAEPGVIFFDHVNKYNPFYDHLGPIVTTNPCGEVLLYPNESCNLGSINVWRFVKRDENKVEVDWDGLKETVRIAVRFLDNVIDINKYPLEEIREMTFSTRKIGLGIMGLADMLFELDLAYNSEEGRKFMEKLMEFINYWSKVESIELAKKRGKLPFFDKSFYKDGKLPFSGFYDKQSWNFDWDKISEDIKKHGIRNGYTTVIAPTGSISMIAGCSSGIEPVFTLVYEKNVAIGSFFYVEPVFERAMTEEGLYDEVLLKDIALNKGSIQGIKYIPPKMKKVFVTAMDIKPEDHIKALASFQKWVDSSISKTNNLPATATVEDVKKIYLLAYKLGCKDVTVYRDSSIQEQVYVAPTIEKKQTKIEDNGNSNGELPSAKQLTKCPECGSTLVHGEGCVTCPNCGWGLCK